ncbi:2-oxo acid dehydrogenase subunit E2 [Hyphomonas jannaschiana]|uniref:2-oxo acid dehydrogenase subunit E2 n=1 Tax=Hyphomonas jannaschiana TaxID=86 RepID=UPI0035C71081
MPPAEPGLPKRIGGVRKIIAERMLASLHSTAQLSYHGDADVTDLMARRSAWKTAGQAISLEDCLIHAIARTLEAYPDFNGVADDVSITRHESIDLSLAISTPMGLMTPVLRDVGSMPLVDIADRRRDLIERAQVGKLAVSEMKGGSFTLSNLGHTRVRYFTPILNAGQIALLGVGRLVETAIVDEVGHPKAARMLPLSLTADHRIVDGEPAGQFLDQLCRHLEQFRAKP